MIKYLRYCTRFGKPQSLYSFNSEGKRLFSFAKSHPFKTKTGELNEKGLVLTHLTDFFPENGYIETARSAIGGARDSVHFAVNHGVTSHDWGSWDGTKYAVIMNWKRTLNESENVFIGGIPSDIFSAGKVKIPKGSVIIKRNPELKAKYKLVDTPKSLPEGTIVIETSAENMKEATDEVIKLLGYRTKNAVDPSFWGDCRQTTKVLENSRIIPCNAVRRSGVKDMRLFRQLLSEKGMKMMAHAQTPNCMAEYLIEEIFIFSALNKKWISEYNGKVINNTKEQLLNHIDFLEQLSKGNNNKSDFHILAFKNIMSKFAKCFGYVGKQAKNNNYRLDFDLSALKEIILKSKTPSEAAELIQRDLKINPMSDLELIKKVMPNLPESDALKSLLHLEYENVGTHETTKKTNEKLREFFAGNMGVDDIGTLGLFNVNTYARMERDIDALF